MTSEQLLRSLRAAVDATPEDLALRLHLAELLATSGDFTEAVRQAATALVQEPGNEAAMRLLAQCSVDEERISESADAFTAVFPSDAEIVRSMEDELSDVLPAMFVNDDPQQALHPGEVEASGLRLSDVGGMDAVKARLEAAFLAPLRNPQLVELYGKSLRGGLLLYGPPGCGKTFIARALAGEMGAKFLSVSLADVLDMYVGQSERNLHDVFETARRSAPCVVFLDEVDAMGQKRSQTRHSATRGTVNQLLSEMDGLGSTNEGVYVLGATNHPWDVDVALRRPGRFDRTVLVLPPDGVAREAIFRYHLSSRPIANGSLRRMAEVTDGYSGADIAYVCENAAERALLHSARSGVVRMIEMADLEHAVNDVRPSIGPWLDTARNVAQFANDGGTYDDLLTYLRQRRLL